MKGPHEERDGPSNHHTGVSPWGLEMAEQYLHTFHDSGIQKTSSASKLHVIVQVLSHFFNTFTRTPLLSFFG